MTHGRMEKAMINRDVLLLYDNSVLADTRPAKIKYQAVAHRIAGILGGEVLPLDSRTENDSLYGVPFDAVDVFTATDYGMKGVGDLYGGVVQHRSQADKSILHPLVTDDAVCPHWYTPALAEFAEDAIMTGFTVFSAQDARIAAEKLHRQGWQDLRTKEPQCLGGAGQSILASQNDLDNLQQNNGVSEQHGLVIEPNLRRPRIYSAGTLHLAGHTISWVGSPWNKMVSGELKFAGNRILAIKGDLNDLSATFDRSSQLSLAVAKAAVVHEGYGKAIGAIISRATYDICTTDEVSGVIDPSLRPSGTSPAELAAYEILTTGELDVVEAAVYHAYSERDRDTIPPNSELFAKSEYVTISTTVQAK
jgi:hypothetical protein